MNLTIHDFIFGQRVQLKNNISQFGTVVRIGTGVNALVGVRFDGRTYVSWLPANDFYKVD